MSWYYGTLQGQAGQATRRGSKNSGLNVAAAIWNGAVYVRLWHDPKTGPDRYVIELGPWHGHGGPTVTLAEGFITRP